MRVWLAVDRAGLEAYVPGSELAGRDGLAVTPAWAAEQGESDLDVLEGLRLDTIEAAAVVVVDAPADVVDDPAGEVRVGPGLAKVAAYFVADLDGDYSWFGPTERDAALEAAARWHSN